MDMVKMVRRDYKMYLYKLWGAQCSLCPKNKCTHCVEEKKYLGELLDKKCKQRKEKE